MKQMVLNGMTAVPAMVLALALVGPAAAQGLPKGKGIETYEAVCGACHGADIVLGSMGSRARWEETVEGMKNRGAYGSDEDFKIVTDYLALYFGNEINVNMAKPEDLKKELALTDTHVKAIVTAREKAPIADFAALTAIPELKDAKLDLLKTRIKFADKKASGAK